MPKSKNRHNHKAAIAMRKGRKEKEAILQKRQMNKFIEEQRAKSIERYNLEESLENLEKIELTDSNTKNVQEIEELVASIEDEYSRGFFSGRLDLLTTDRISAEDFVAEMKELIQGKKDQEEDAPEPVSADNVEDTHKEVIEQMAQDPDEEE